MGAKVQSHHGHHVLSDLGLKVRRHAVFWNAPSTQAARLKVGGAPRLPECKALTTWSRVFLLLHLENPSAHMSWSQTSP